MGSLDSAGRVWFPHGSWAVTFKIHHSLRPPALLKLIMSLKEKTLMEADRTPSRSTAWPGCVDNTFVRKKGAHLEWLTAQAWAEGHSGYEICHALYWFCYYKEVTYLF